MELVRGVAHFSRRSFKYAILQTVNPMSLASSSFMGEHSNCLY
jgi:hypothetical protein